MADLTMGRHLEVTFRDGKPFAAYLCLPRQVEDRSVRTERRPGGLLVDFAADGRAIGVEITSPKMLSLETLNEVLASIHATPATQTELGPLAA